MQICESAKRTAMIDVTATPNRSASRAARRWAIITGVIALTAWCLGCGTPPRAYVSDPAVYTIAHLEGIQKQVGGDTALVKDLGRYFQTPAKTYPDVKTRMDQMLDGDQRVSEHLQAIQTSLTLAMAMNLMKPTADSKPGPEQTLPPREQLKAGLLDKLIKNMKENPLEGTPTDSPFDTLDRVTDLYLTYMIKLLKRYPDSRTSVVPKSPVTPLKPGESKEHFDYRKAVADMADKQDEEEDGRINADQANLDRVLVLVFQAHLHPGTQPNRMAGVRVKVVGATVTGNDFDKLPERWQIMMKRTYDDEALIRPWFERTEERTRRLDAAKQASLVRILHVHPTRNYDVDRVSYAEMLTQTLGIYLAAAAPVGQGDMKGYIDRQAVLETQERSKFLSHISKNVSFANASTHEFGWNFYPSNLEVVRVTGPRKFFGWLIGTPREFDLYSYLEGGARDCAVVVVVPQGLESITCEMTSVDDIVDRTQLDHEQVIDKPRPFTILLPKWNSAEARSLYWRMPPKDEPKPEEPKQATPKPESLPPGTSTTTTTTATSVVPPAPAAKPAEQPKTKPGSGPSPAPANSAAPGASTTSKTSTTTTTTTTTVVPPDKGDQAEPKQEAPAKPKPGTSAGQPAPPAAPSAPPAKPK